MAKQVGSTFHPCRFGESDYFMRQTTPAEVDYWLQNLHSLQETRECRAPEFFRPFHFVSLALVLKANKAGRIELPEAVKRYATRMHLWVAVGLRPPHQFNEQNSEGRFVPIETLRSRDLVNDCSQRVMEIAAKANLSQEAKESLDIAISELMDNCFAHAGIEDGGLHGLACAQYWPRGNLLQVAIADMGMGVRASLENADKEETRDRAKAENCCNLATQLHTTSKSEKGHAGYGLALSRQLVANNGGTMGLYSGSEWLHVAGTNSQNGNQSVGWQGTLVLLEFDTTSVISTQKVYQAWPQVRGYSDDDFDF
ncbi:ATP-binding protein [Comamonas odontotermitis]|uniref:ATP-binding protein n=1 Tax=Comamonas odontotermitis TaxID=379895 RepID=UPI003671C632